MKWKVSSLCLAAVIVASLVSPAIGGPSLAGLSRREQRDYKNLDRRVRALSTVVLSKHLRTHIVFDNLERNGNYWTGGAVCLKGEITGGGVD